MAGEGRRFRDAGYDLPKPLIPVCGVPMIQAAIDSLGVSGRWIFITRDNSELADTLARLRPECHMIQTLELTEGPACSALLARYLIDDDTPLLIANCDQIMTWDATAFNDAIRRCEHDGLIVTYPANTPKNSYATVDDNGFVTRIAEKQQISHISLNGIHWWKRGSDFVKSAKKMIADNKRVNGEFFVGPTYNELIAEGKKIVTYPIDAKDHCAVGVPDDLKRYEAFIT